MRVLQINTILNYGSTAKIAQSIGELLIEYHHESYIAYGRGAPQSNSKSIKIGSFLDSFYHKIFTLLTDKHCFASRIATKRFIKKINLINPDLIVLHNVHGYFLNIEILFSYISKKNIPIVWLLHDCWPFTGHCTHFENINCLKWKIECNNCPKKSFYPKSLKDNSLFNFINKKQIFTQTNNLHIITPSLWLKNYVEMSFLKEYPVQVINNGIDVNTFKPTMPKRKMLLFVSSIWTNSKGLNDIFMLRKIMDSSFEFVIVGLNKKQIHNLPEGIIGYSRIYDNNQLVNLFSSALCFINPTYSDNFPTVNLEALATGTPVITYNTGGCNETIDEKTGFIVEKGDINGLKLKVFELLNPNSKISSILCRTRAVNHFNKDIVYKSYLSFFEKIIN